MAQGTPTRQELEAFAEAEAQRQGVPPQLVKAMIDVESNWNTKARSSKDARGLMQLRSPAAAEVGVRDRDDPVQNIRGGVAYIKKQLNRFGDTGLALAAYNWGPKHAAQLESNPRGPRIPNQTLNYVPEVFARMRRYGQMLAPSAFTLSLYPRMREVLANETLTSVRDKLGMQSKGEIERAIQTGNTPLPPPAAPAQPPELGPGATLAEPPASGAAVMAGAPPPTIPAPPAQSAPEAQIASQEAQIASQEAALSTGRQLPGPARRLPAPTRGNAESMKTYLRSQFGPLAELADPFPAAFDAELERIIERA